MTYYAIDRFEGTFALLEDGEGRTFPVPREALPAGVKQGDVLALEGGEYRPAPEETSRRRAAARRLEDLLRGD